jgi:hypothetical protein
VSSPDCRPLGDSGLPGNTERDTLFLFAWIAF